MPSDYIAENLPTNFKPNSPYIVSPSDSKLQFQLLPIEYDVVGQKIRITNTSEKLVNLEKKSQAFQVCPLHTDLPDKIKEHIPHVNKDPIPNNTQDPQTYLSCLTYDPDGVIAKLPNGPNIIQRLKEINAEYY